MLGAAAADMILYLYDNIGKFTGMNDNAGLYNDPLLSRTFSEAGTYYLRIKPVSEAGYGDTVARRVYLLENS